MKQLISKLLDDKTHGIVTLTRLLRVLVAIISPLQNYAKIHFKMSETLSHRYASDRTQWELTNEYQHGRDWIVFKNICVVLLWVKVASALDGLKKDQTQKQTYMNFLSPHCSSGS